MKDIKLFVFLSYLSNFLLVVDDALAAHLGRENEKRTLAGAR